MTKHAAPFFYFLSGASCAAIVAAAIRGDLGWSLMFASAAFANLTMASYMGRS